MKKKKILTLFLAAATVLSLAACGKDTISAGVETDTQVEEPVREEVTVNENKTEYAIENEYVQVVEYKGLVADSFDNSVSENEVDEYIDSIIRYYYESQAIEAPAENEDVTDEAEEAKEIDETVEAVEDVEMPTHDSLTDEFVVKLSGGEYSDVASFREHIKTVIKNESDAYSIDAIKNSLFYQVVDGSNLVSYNDSDLQNYIDYSNEYYAEYAEYLGLTLEAFYQNNLNLSTEDEFNKYVYDEAMENLKTEYIIHAIAEKENIVVSDEEIDNEVQGYIDYGYFSTKEDVLEYITRDEIKTNLEYYQILNILYDNAEFVAAE